MPTSQQCKNCELEFDVSYDYCPHCGQEAADNLTVGVLFSNTIENYFAIDARFFKSFATLMIKPGVLARRFVDGKRLKYLHPAQFYLFVSVVFFFLFSFAVREADNEVSQGIKKGFEQGMNLDSNQVIADSTGIEGVKKALINNKDIIGLSDDDFLELDSSIFSNSMPVDISLGFDREQLDSLIAVGAPVDQKLRAMGVEDDASTFSRTIYTQLLKFYEKQGKGILQVLYDTIPIAMFLLLPLFAIILKLFYRKPATFAHHLVFSFYYFTFIFTSFCLIILGNKITEIPIGLEVLICLSFIIYLTLALRNFYRSTWIKALIKAYFISLLYMIIVIPLAGLGIILAAFMRN